MFPRVSVLKSRVSAERRTRWWAGAAITVLLVVAIGCGGPSGDARERSTNEGARERSGAAAGASGASAGGEREGTEVTFGEDAVPRDQFAMGMAMISARRLCGTQRMCFVGTTPDRCVRELGDAVLAYAIEGADLPDPVPPERQRRFLDRELQPLAMMVFASHAEAGERECGPGDAIRAAVVVRPPGCIRLEDDATPCGR